MGGLPLKKRSNQEMTYDEWLKVKAKTRLFDEINKKVGELTIKVGSLKDSLSKFKSKETVEKNRRQKDRAFKEFFLGYFTPTKLDIKPFNSDRYEKIYRISSFPSQGVELHKTVLAYHFAFNRLIQETAKAHRFPFLLDAIFKEDIESENKSRIVKFIAENKPKDTQLFFSVATTSKETETVVGYNSKYFDGKAELICIGQSSNKRSFLMPYSDDSLDKFISDTYEMMES